MITLLHGEDTTKSRNAFVDEKKHFPDAVILNGVSITPTDLTQSLGSEDLFGETKHVFIENLLSKRKSSKEVESLTTLISQTPQQVTLWESKELTKKQLQQLGNAKIQDFKVPTIIFTFLDNLKPKNGKQLVELFHQILLDNEAEYVLFMLQRQVRILLAFSSPSEAKGNTSVIPAKAGIQEDGSLIKSGMTISELSRMAPWQKGKLEKQAKSFSQQQLLDLHSKLFDIDLAQKTGGLTMSLTDTIDFLLLSI